MLDGALLTVMLLLSACAMDGSDTRAPCLPVVECSAAEEVEALPEGAVVVAMLSDYAVPRDQAREAAIRSSYKSWKDK